MNKWKRWRTISQLVFVVFIAFVGIRHQVVGGGPNGAAPIDTYCVFGGVETFFSWITTGVFLQKTNMSNIILLGALIVSVLLVGSAFCGWICPLGAVQEWFGKLGRKLFGRQLRVPDKLDRVLQYVKYPVLVAILYLTVLENSLWFEDYDPFKVLFHFSFETTTAWIVLFTFLALSLLVERFWCKYLCPVAAIINPLSRFSLFKLSRDKNLCVSCKACNPTCSMGKAEPGVQKTFTDSCTLCLDCVDTCRSKQALGLKLGPRILGPNLKAKAIVPAALLGVFALAILITMLSGVWVTKQTASETIEYDSSGQVAVEDIKGWMTLSDVSERYNKPIPELLEKLGLDSNTDAKSKLKDLAAEKGLEMEDFKDTLQEVVSSASP